MASAEASVPAGLDDELGLQRLLLTLWSRRWWIIAPMVGLTIIAAAIAVTMTPVYRASTILVPASADNGGLGNSVGSALNSLGGLASLAGVNLKSGGGEVEEAIAVLKSRQFIEAFIRDKRLLPLLYQDKWDPQAQAWRDGEEPTFAKAHDYFVKKVLSVVQDNRSALVVIQVDWPDRELAAEWANVLVQRLNGEMRTRALQKAAASVQYLEQELARTSMLGAQEAISRLIEAQINQRMLANVIEEYAFRIVDRAMPPDVDNPLRPNRPVIVAAGAILGVVVGVLAVLLSTLFWPRAVHGGGRAQ
jgi:uncharacterized protein involved in exopolysaccharide biosynthesis